MRNRLRAILITVILLPALAHGADDENSPPRTISTSGEAVVYVVPDEVVVNFGVETFDPSLDKAKAENDQLSQSLIKAIRAMGVEEKFLQADSMNVNIRLKDYDRKIEGYHAQRSYAVRLKDTKKFEALIDTALKSGANRIYGFEYRTSELRQHRDKARTMAIVAAREKAEALSGALGCQIGKPRTISESGSGYWGGGWNYRGGNMLANSQVSAQAPPGEGGDEDVMPLGQIAVRANVSVVFDLVPG